MAAAALRTGSRRELGAAYTNADHSNTRQTCEAMMASTAEVYRQAGITIEWLDMRMIEDGKMVYANSGEQERWTESHYDASASWLDVYFVQDTYESEDTLDGATGRPQYHGVCLHPKRENSAEAAWGVWIYVRVSEWTTLAHELGHAFGLPHVVGGDSDAEVPYIGGLDDYSFYPLSNDTRGVSRNIMVQGTNVEQDPGYFLWTKGQCLLMRRTLATRASQWAYADANKASWYDVTALPRGAYRLPDCARLLGARCG